MPAVDGTGHGDGRHAVEAMLGERDRKILGALVEEFVETAEPIGSRSLTKRYRLDVSPATVRNVMADLEETGYLAQPHTSAGRVPTDKGYRYYVDHLMSAEPLPAGERRQLRRTITRAEITDLEDLLESTSQALSTVAKQVGVVVAPRFESSVFRHIDFVLLKEGHVLVVLVSQSGLVYHRPVEAPEIDSQAELDHMAGYLNTLLQDVPLCDVRERILSEMATEKALYDRLLGKALRLGNRVLEQAQPRGELFVGDTVALLDHPEFSDVSRMRGIFEAFQKKGLLLKILDRAAEAVGIVAVIGHENPVRDLHECSVVSSTYGRGGQVLGTVGIIGPTRMRYPRIVGLVQYTARLLGERLDSM
jgi:heat-inducible transcriptional repressor